MSSKQQLHMKSTITPGTLISTDEYKIYARLVIWGYQHKSVCHAQGEYARDEDGDGFHEVHVDTRGRFLVSTSFLATATLRNFSRKTATVSWLF